MPFIPIVKMTATVIKSIFVGSACKMYPVTKHEPFEATRGSIKIEASKCIFCGLCVKRCVSDALKVDKPSKKWSIERMKCIMCLACIECCPKKCLSISKQYSPPSENKDPDEFTG